MTEITMGAPRTLLLTGLLALALQGHAQEPEPDGARIMAAARQAMAQEHAVYEEISLILLDHLGNRDTRSLRRYSRHEPDGSMRLLLLFDAPADVQGVAMLVIRDASGSENASLYLPAHGRVLAPDGVLDPDQLLFGSDFSLHELTGELLYDYRFVRREDRRIDDTDYYQVDVYPGHDDDATTQPVMRHYIRQDGYNVIRTDYLDHYGRLLRQLNRHDLQRTPSGRWSASMMLMENFRESHQSLLKVNRRVLSESYVPEEVFTHNWLLQNQPPLEYDIPVDDGIEAELIGDIVTPGNGSVAHHGSGAP